MLKYTLQRLLYLLLVFLTIACMCFVLIRMLPPPIPNPQDKGAAMIIEMRREALGYNKPYLVQFGIYVKNVVTEGNFGVSEVLYPGRNVAEVFMEKLPATMLVNVYAILWSIPVGIALGIWAALKKNSRTDYLISTLTMVCISVPSFVYAFLVQYFFCFKLGWFPLTMNIGTNYFTADMFKSMVPAILSLSFGTIAGFTRTTRAELTEVLTNDFMLLARTKGLTKAQATIRHAMKNCMVVVLPGIFGSFIGILGGSLIIEGIFSIPGVGGLTLAAISGKGSDIDTYVFMLTTCFYTAIGLLGALVVDVSYGFIDPRIRMGSKK